MTDAYNLLHQLRYQLAPGVHTFGPCDPLCGQSARGSGTCADCLAKQLAERVPGFDWGALISALRHSAKMIGDAEQAIYEAGK